MLNDELLAYLFQGRSHILARPMAAWLESSRRFAEFANAFRDKIRKKLRTAPDRASLLDLQLELETAWLLLRERALSLEYEPPQSGPGRRPDFAVSYTTSLTFMLEVTRLRANLKSTQGAALEQTAKPVPDTVPTIPLLSERLGDTISGKLGQLLPQRSNVLLVGVEDLVLTESDLRALMLSIKQRAESDDLLFFERHRFRDRAAFFRHYLRLSVVMVRGTPLQGPGPVLMWVNPQAQHPLPSKALTALARSHTL